MIAHRMHHACICEWLLIECIMCMHVYVCAHRVHQSLEAHPNVVGLIASGVDSGHSYLVFELVEGTSLRKQLDEKGRLSPERSARRGHLRAATLEA